MTGPFLGAHNTAVVDVELSAFPPFDPRGDVMSIGLRWKKLRKAVGYIIMGKGIVNDDHKKALLLHCAGMDVQINEPFERHVFRGLYQEEGRNSGPISDKATTAI